MVLRGNHCESYLDRAYEFQVPPMMKIDFNGKRVKTSDTRHFSGTKKKKTDHFKKK